MKLELNIKTLESAKLTLQPPGEQPDPRKERDCVVLEVLIDGECIRRSPMFVKDSVSFRALG